VAGGQILAFPIDFDRRPYNTLALPCECVIKRLTIDLENGCVLSHAISIRDIGGAHRGLEGGG